MARSKIGHEDRRSSVLGSAAGLAPRRRHGPIASRRDDPRLRGAPATKRFPSVGRIRRPPEDVTRLATQHAADRVQGAQPDGSGAPILQHGDVRRANADGLSEVAYGHLASGEHDVEIHGDGHQITSSSSVRSAIADSSRPRMTIIRSTNAIPPARLAASQRMMPSPPPWTTSRWVHTPAFRTVATAPQAVMMSTKRRERRGGGGKEHPADDHG